MKKNVVLFYVDDCLYCYTYEAIVKWFVDSLGKNFHLNFFGIFKLVHVIHNLSDEGPFHLSRSG